MTLQVSLCQTLSETPKTGFLASRLILYGCVFVMLSLNRLFTTIVILNEPVRDKTNNLGFRPGLTQTSLYSHRKELEALNFGFK